MARIAALALVALLIQALVAAPVSAATPQEITFEPDADGRVGDVLVLDATADSGLPVTYTTSTPTMCSIEVDGLHLDAVGTCSVTASQPGDDDYLPATDVTRAVTIKPALVAQTIAFDPPASGVTGGTVPLFAVATSGRPVSFATTTPGTCSIDGTTLRLLTTGTCTVTASQAGGDPYAVAPDVVRDIEIGINPITTASGANLGRYAFNGAIVDSVIDPSTGITYVGGAFNQVGIRTGNVAVVEGPDAGGDGIRSSNPDVVGEAVAVFPDDASGYFMSGHISSINGDGVSRAGIVRMTNAGKLDPTWSAPDVCELGDMWDLGKWIGVRVRMSGDTDGFSTLGLQLVSKATGKAYMTGAGTQRCGASGRMWSATGPFAPLGGSDSDILDVTMDASTNTLVMRVSDAYVVAYDMTTGARRWSYPLVGLPSDVSAFGGVVLLTGELQPEFDIASMSSLILLDAADGTVLQRWNPSGEQDLADPTQTTGPSTSCLPANDGLRNYVRHEFAHVDPETAIGYGVPSGTGLTRTVPVCRYSVTGSGHGARLVATDLGTLTAHADPFAFFQLPSTPYLGRYLVGGYDAFDLQTGTQVPDWHPEPSVGIDLRTTVVGHDVVFGGPFTFTHGQAAEHVAAVDDSLSPVDDFDVDLPDTEQSSAGQQEVRALSLVGDKLMVVGDLKSDDGRGPVVALDATSGDRTWALIPDDLSIGWSVAPAAVGGGFYLGTIWPVDDLPILSRFVPDGGDFTSDGTWTPDLAAMDGLAPSVTELALVDDRLYVGGSFGSIDGATRHGLARFSADGTIDGWAPSLLEEADPGIKPSDVQPHAFVEMGDVVVVGGTHRFYAGTPPATETSAIQMFSSTTGERIRPTGSDAPWYPGAVYAIYDVDLAGGILYAALGSGGIGAFDATTFDYLPSRSIRTQPGWGNNEVYSISVAPRGRCVPRPGCRRPAVRHDGRRWRAPALGSPLGRERRRGRRGGPHGPRDPECRPRAARNERRPGRQGGGPILRGRDRCHHRRDADGREHEREGLGNRHIRRDETDPHHQAQGPADRRSFVPGQGR